jgi:ketosteroid isomerase-like protein
MTRPKAMTSKTGRARIIVALFGAMLMVTAAIARATMTDDEKTVADLDTRFQAAVKANDAATMDAILHDRMVLVVGSGKIFTKADLLEEARSKRYVWEYQDEETGSQTVRSWGDTAVVTAKLWIKGTESGKAFDRKVWFSDTYVRTPTGWRYAFGQSSLPLPKDQ